MNLLNVVMHCTIPDKSLRIIGKMHGKWYEDHMLDFINENPLMQVEIIEETDTELIIKEAEQ